MCPNSFAEGGEEKVEQVDIPVQSTFKLETEVADVWDILAEILLDMHSHHLVICIFFKDYDFLIFRPKLSSVIQVFQSQSH